MGGNDHFCAVVDRLLPRGNGGIGHVFIRHRNFQSAAVPENCTDRASFQVVEHPELFGQIGRKEFRTGKRGAAVVVPERTEHDLSFFVFILQKEPVGGNHGIMSDGCAPPEVVIGQQEPLKG